MDETPTNRAWAEVVCDVLSGTEQRVSVEQVLQAQRAAASGGHSNPKHGALVLLTGEYADDLHRQVTARSWALLDEPFPDAMPVLEALAAEGFRLGVIANQPRAMAQARLEWSGLLDLIEVTVLSGDVGLAKPDPAIFQLALSMAGCAPEEALMAGDRLDNDIAPAKRLGLSTVWIRRGLHAGYVPRSAAEEPDATVSSLVELQTLLLGQ